MGGLVREGHSPVIPLTDLRPSRTNPSICIYQHFNQTHSVHLPQRQTWGHMISSFKFINHIVLCHLASPHESIPSPRSSQCRAPPLRAHINQSHRPDLVSVVRPHGSPPQINSIAPIQSRAPMARPHTQSHRPHPASVAPPWHAPTNQSHLPYPVARPHDASPLINAIAPFQPVSCTP